MHNDYNARELVDEGVENFALEFINAFILKTRSIHHYSFIVDVLDAVVKNFICYFKDVVSCLPMLKRKN